MFCHFSVKKRHFHRFCIVHRFAYLISLQKYGFSVILHIDKS